MINDHYLNFEHISQFGEQEELIGHMCEILDTLAVKIENGEIKLDNK